MRNRKKRILHSVLLVSSLAFGQSSPSLKELIEGAIERDLQYQQQNIDIKYTNLDQKKLKDTFLPKVELSGKFGYNHNELNFTFPEIALPAIPRMFPGFRVEEHRNTLNLSGFMGVAKLQTSVVLYSGGKVGYLKKALEEKEISQKELQKGNKNEVISSITKVYDQFALIHQSKKVLDESKKRLEINKKTAEKALGYGLITPYDYKKIELAQITLEAKLVEYEGKRDLLVTQLHLLTGVERERIAQIEPVLEPIEYWVKEPSVENRPEIKALEHGIRATEYKTKAEKTWWIPKVQFSTSLSYLELYKDHIYTDKNIGNKEINRYSEPLSLFPRFEAGVGFKWNIFDGNQGKREVEKNKIDKEVLENKKADALRKLKLNLANHQTNYNINLAQIELKDKARKLAKIALDQVEKEFRYGVKKSMDLIDAENDLEIAELEYQTAVFNQRRTAIDLMRATENLEIEKF